MSCNCTVYCKDSCVEYVATALRELFSDVEIVVSEGGTRITVETESGSLALTLLVFREPGDKFAKLRLSTYMFFSRRGGNEQTKQHLLDHLESSEMIIGIVARPALDSDQRFTQAVFSLAIELDGLIFTGSEMVDATGATIMQATIN